MFKSILALGLLCGAMAQEKLPIGMNLPGFNYYTPAVVFTDVMKSASAYVSYDVSGVNTAWGTNQQDLIPKTETGYPAEIPYTVEGTPLGVRLLLNNYHQGEFIFRYEGEGEISFHLKGYELSEGKHYVSFDGTGGHTWIQIISSLKENPIRNIQIIPVEYENTPYEEIPVFTEAYKKGLEPFHAFRLMDWIETNNSHEVKWEDRVQKDHYSQAYRGISFDYGIALVNEMEKDVWVCVPHAADDEYIRNLAQLFKDSLDPRLHIYLEYSNEIWNWGFQQAHYVGRNGTDEANPFLNAHDTVQAGLRAVAQKYCDDPEAYCHPEKDAYMMARTFKIWEAVFADQRERLSTVAAVQHSWVGNTGRILEYLFNDDGVGADIVSPGGYFSFSEEQHEAWNAMDPSLVTPEMIIDSVAARYAANSGAWTEETAEYANTYGVEYAVYEGGQHMQPWLQGEYDYNQAIWDAQIHPRMYDLYMTSFDKHVEVGTKLFMAFSYVGDRESRWGSWGHLEKLEDVDHPNLMEKAPKYQALLDRNSPLVVREPVSSVAKQLPALFNGEERNPVRYQVNGEKAVLSGVYFEKFPAGLWMKKVRLD